MKATFGEYIKKLRTNNGLTLTQLAFQLDLDSANLSKIENGKREFDEKRLDKLATAFNLDINQLKVEYLKGIHLFLLVKISCFFVRQNMQKYNILFLFLLVVHPILARLL